MHTRFERQQDFQRIDRWLQEFHRRAPVLFALMCAGIAISIFGLAGIVVDLIGR